MTVAPDAAELLRVHRHGAARRRSTTRCRELLDARRPAADARSTRYPRQFSGGQRQRVSIARALALEPDCWSPTSRSRRSTCPCRRPCSTCWTSCARELGLTMLFIAHNMAVVRHVCDRVAVMYLGRIVETAPTEELFTNPRHPYTQGLLQAVPRLVPGRASEAPAMVGDPPSPIRPPERLPLPPRCPIAQDICSTDDPALFAAGTTATSGGLPNSHGRRPRRRTCPRWSPTPARSRPTRPSPGRQVAGEGGEAAVRDAVTAVPPRPVIVSAATSALTIASSVASMAAQNSGLIQRPASTVELHADRPWRRRPVARSGRGCRSRSARNRSPLECSPRAPGARDARAPARWASRSHWWGSSGASVATMTMIEPAPAGRRARRRRHGHLVGRRSRGRPARRPTRQPLARGRGSPAPARRPSSRRRRGSTRDAVPMPPLNSWQIMPVPPPTLPSRTGPSAARRERRERRARAARACR